MSGVRRALWRKKDPPGQGGNRRGKLSKLRVIKLKIKRESEPKQSSKNIGEFIYKKAVAQNTFQPHDKTTNS